MKTLQKVSAYPQMREGQFKGRIHGTYRFKEIRDGNVILELDPTFSPQQMAIPIEMLQENDIDWVWRSSTFSPDMKLPDVDKAVKEGQITEDEAAEYRQRMDKLFLADGYQLNASASHTDAVCYLSSTYDGKTLFFKVDGPAAELYKRFDELKKKHAKA